MSGEKENGGVIIKGILRSVAMMDIPIDNCDTLHPMQAAFKEHHALQCGFCTPGMVMCALDLVKRNGKPSETEIRAYLEGNFCRCTGYHNIVKAIAAGAEAMAGQG